MLEFEIFDIHNFFKFVIVVKIIAILSLIFDISPSPWCVCVCAGWCVSLADDPGEGVNAGVCVCMCVCVHACVCVCRVVRFPWQMTQDKVRRVLQEALRVWSDVTPLTFAEVDSGEADIIIDFNR